MHIDKTKNTNNKADGSLNKKQCYRGYRCVSAVIMPFKVTDFSTN